MFEGWGWLQYVVAIVFTLEVFWCLFLHLVERKGYARIVNLAFYVSVLTALGFWK